MLAKMSNSPASAHTTAVQAVKGTTLAVAAAAASAHVVMRAMAPAKTAMEEAALHNHHLPLHKMQALHAPCQLSGHVWESRAHVLPCQCLPQLLVTSPTCTLASNNRATPPGNPLTAPTSSLGLCTSCQPTLQLPRPLPRPVSSPPHLQQGRKSAVEAQSWLPCVRPTARSRWGEGGGSSLLLSHWHHDAVRGPKRPPL